jgi:putative mycofactocin binding protein MftB
LSAFTATAPWSLDDHVSLRDEPFGALAYHHVTRRLIFLKSPQLVDVVRHLGEYSSASAAVAAFVEEPHRAQYERALAALATSEIICER